METPARLVDLAQQNVDTIARMEQAAQAQHSHLDRFIDTITRFIGSLPFICLHLLWFTLWIGLNMASPRQHPFDPFPFTLLSLAVGMEAIILAAFILITQNRQQQLADRRAHLELQINIGKIWIFLLRLSLGWTPGRSTSGRAANTTYGRRTTNSLPFPGPSLQAVTLPPCNSSSRRTSDSPRSRPPCAESREPFTLVKGSKTRRSMSGGMPRPVSCTRITACSPS